MIDRNVVMEEIKDLDVGILIFIMIVVEKMVRIILGIFFRVGNMMMMLNDSE